MKKLKVFLLAIVCLCGGIIFSACNEDEFKVDFYVDGTIYATINTNGNETITIPQNPTKDNYTFDGWYYDNGTWQRPFTANSLINEPLTSDLKVYSKWADNFLMYALNNGEYSICGYDKSLDVKDVTIYSSFRNKPVTSIGNGAFYNCSNLTSIAIPNSVTSIGDYAFYYCNNLTSIIIPSSVKSIGNGAFYNCSSLTSIKFEENSQLTSIGQYAFYGCTTTINWGDNPTIASLEAYAFSGYQGDSITIPSSLANIEDSAFYDCSSLTKVNIFDLSAWCNICFRTYSSNPLYYAKHLYLNDEEITNLVIPSTVTSISNAFQGCSSFTSITVPSSVISIGNLAFAYCNNLTSITFEENSQLTSIGESAFCDCSSLISITIPSSVTSIGRYAFEGCSGLTSIIFEENSQLTSIGDYAFYECRGLTSITIPSSVTSIGNGAFYNCSNLTSIAIPNSVTSIGDYAFYYCNNLTSIIIPSSVKSIGKGAFYNCRSLNCIKIEENSELKSIGQKAFYGCTTTINWGDNPTIASLEAYAFSGYQGDSITIPSSVTSVGDGVFVNCTNLTSITFEQNSELIGIGDYAFYECRGLTSITIPSSVTSIGNGAFYNCSKLTNIVFENSSGWYRTTSKSDWQNKTGGTPMDLSNSSTNAEYFKETYKYYYWYKVD